MTRLRSLLPLLILLCVYLPTLSAANRERDPLTQDETNQLRDVSDEPVKKLALYVKFINQRMQSIERLRSDPHPPQDRAARLHELLEDFSSLSDELGDNVDEAVTRYADIRKVLPSIISANSDWQKSLEALQAGTGSGNISVDEAKQYEFVLADALEAVRQAGPSYSAVLEKQKVEIPRLQKEAKEREKKRREQE